MSARELVQRALLIALVAAATSAVKIATPGTQGYVNFGDVVIIAGALLLGGRTGAVAGGVGSALADLFGGYSHWAPFTLVIKGLEGGLVGGLAGRFRPNLRRPAGLVLGGALALLAVSWMVAGYFAAECWLYSLGPAVASVPGNVAQALAGLAGGVPLAAALQGRVGLTPRA